MGQDVFLPDTGATERLGQQLARQLTAPVCVLLEGDLGAGKTSLARALIRAMTMFAEAEVPSPTFTLLQTYETPQGPVYHYDLYRLKQPDEVYELDWETAMADAIVLVEWPERLGTLRPLHAKTIQLKIDGDGRIARLEGFNDVSL